MLKVQLKSEPIILCCSINIPRYLAEQLKLNCANLGPGVDKKIRYYPKPEELQKLMDYVKAAPASLFRFDCLKDGKEAESNFAQVLQDYNRNHPDGKIDHSDLIKAVKSIDVKDQHFAGAKRAKTTAKKTKYDYGVFYEWRMPLSVLFPDTAAVDETIKGSKNPLHRDALYIKLFVPDEPGRKGYYYEDQDEVQVASLHRNSDSRFFGYNKQKEDAERAKLGDEKYQERLNKKKEAGKRYFKSKEEVAERQIARQVTKEADYNDEEPEMVE
jgi:hypothetical protein